MKSDFMIAITQLSAEKKLPKETVLAAVEAALVSAYKRDDPSSENISVKINPDSGEVKVYAPKAIVEMPTDPCREISLAEGKKLKEDAQIGDIIEVESTPRDAGRIAAQTARQVVLQRLREAEQGAILEEFANKENDIVSGVVQRIESRQVFIDLGRTEAVLPATEQVRTDRYRVGQRIRAYLLEVLRTPKGPQLVVSRSHPNLIRRLFELEVPEVHSGIVELKAIAREAGYRSKVAVTAHQQGIDPIGCCVGLRGVRAQNIVNEINGEKIDTILWDPNPAVFIANALSPSQVVSVEIDEKGKVASVVVPDRQLSLAIGREGQNARLAAKLTGWRIDIKSVSTAERERAERAALEEIDRAEAQAAAPLETPPSAEPAPEVEEKMPEPLAEVKPLPEVALTPKPKEPSKKRQIKFAEELLAPKSIKPDIKAQRKKKKTGARKAGAGEQKEAGIKPKRALRTQDLPPEDEDYAEDGDYLEDKGSAGDEGYLEDKGSAEDKDL